MAKLNTNVHVVEIDGEGRQGTFGPNDRLPDWAVAAISNPDVWEEPPTGGVARPQAGGSVSDAETRATAAEQRAEAAEAELAQLRQQLAGAQSSGPTEPPRGGPGSGVDAWRKFLTDQGVEDLPEGASREDLVALWDARKA